VLFLDTTNSAEDVFENWNNWNRFAITKPIDNFYGFDGFDWDIEGFHLTTSI